MIEFLDFAQDVRRKLFQRVPALRELEGSARRVAEIEIEEAVANVIGDAIEANECEPYG